MIEPRVRCKLDIQSDSVRRYPMDVSRRLVADATSNDESNEQKLGDVDGHAFVTAVFSNL